MNRPYNNQRKKKKKTNNGTYKIEDFAVPADHRIKLEENEKEDQHPDIAKELKKKMWNLKVTIIPIVMVLSPKDY